MSDKYNGLTRYVIYEKYSGVYDKISPICCTYDIKHAELLCSFFRSYRESQDRDCVFDYFYKKTVNDFDPLFDDKDFDPFSNFYKSGGQA